MLAFNTLELSARWHHYIVTRHRLNLLRREVRSSVQNRICTGHTDEILMDVRAAIDSRIFRGRGEKENSGFTSKHNCDE